MQNPILISRLLQCICCLECGVTSSWLCSDRRLMGQIVSWEEIQVPGAKGLPAIHQDWLPKRRPGDSIDHSTSAGILVCRYKYHGCAPRCSPTSITSSQKGSVSKRPHPASEPVGHDAAGSRTPGPGLMLEHIMGGTIRTERRSCNFDAPANGRIQSQSALLSTSLKRIS